MGHIDVPTGEGEGLSGSVCVCVGGHDVMKPHRTLWCLAKLYGKIEFCSRTRASPCGIGDMIVSVLCAVITSR